MTEHDANALIAQLRAELAASRERERSSFTYIREKTNQLLNLMGTLPIRPEELDDQHLIVVDPIGIVTESFRQVLDNLHRTNTNLRLANDEIKAIFDSAGAGILVLDINLNALACNNRLQEMLSIEEPTADVLRPCYELLGCTECPIPDCVATRIIETGESIHQADRLIRDRHYSVAGAPIYDDDGAIHRIILLYSDITDRKEAELAIHQLAYYDTLTNLPNRTLLQDRLTQLINQSAREKSKVAVLFLDLDNFKTINDTLGHAAGDELLQEVARRLSRLMRATDTISRLGGDEFVILLPGIRHEDLVGDIAAKLLSTLTKPLQIAHHEISCSGSIGIALYPDDGDNSALLLKHADLAMYQAKEQGRNTFRFFSHDMNTKAVQRMLFETSLRRALERDEFRLCYHPLLDARTSQVVGCEALLRWQHPDLGLLAPESFVTLAEETGQIVPISDWVLRSACLQHQQWRVAGLPPVRVAVNISAYQFRRGNLLETVSRVLHETGIPAEYLELELTESMLMQEPESARETLSRLKTLGVHLAIDDFGTGYSSLSYLKLFPIDRLKIPREFVRDITSNPDDATIAKAIVSLGNNLNMRVVAEGVERIEQLEFLVQHGCDELQGFYFAQPMTPDEFSDFLAHPRPGGRAGAQHP